MDSNVDSVALFSVVFFCVLARGKICFSTNKIRLLEWWAIVDSNH